MGKFPEPKVGTVFYDDGKVYACLAFEPIVEGHSIVAWKDEVKDLSLLSKEDYQHLMYIVNKVRNVLLKAYNINKVYLAYLDEAEHVHWHLFPRMEGTEKGFKLMCQPHKDLINLTKVSLFQSLLRANG